MKMNQMGAKGILSEKTSPYALDIKEEDAREMTQESAFKKKKTKEGEFMDEKLRGIRMSENLAK